MDIVERLQKQGEFWPNGLANEAADEIERWRWENSNMEKLWGKSERTWMEIRDKQEATIEQLRDALRWAAPYVKDNPRVDSIVQAALKGDE